MKNRFDINKDDLWDKIIVDDRMPRKQPRRFSWIAILASICILLISGLIFKYSDLHTSSTLTINTESENGQLTARINDTDASFDHDAHLTKTRAESDVPTTQEQSRDYQDENIIPNSSENKTNQKSEKNNTENKKTFSRGGEKNNYSKRTDDPQEIINNDDSRGELKTGVDLIPSAKKSHGLDFNNNDKNKASDNTKNNNSTDNKRKIETKVEPVKDNEIKDGVDANIPLNRVTAEDNESPLIQKISGKPKDKGTIDHIKRETVLLRTLDTRINIELLSSSVASPVITLSDLDVKPIKRSSASIYLSMNYGMGLSSLRDSLNTELMENPSVERSSLAAYQIELGVSKLLGSWRVQIGLGADIQQGKCVWTQIDTVYKRLDTRAGFERLENTATRTRYQRYGNVYLTSNLGYRLQKGSWSITPFAGLRYNLINLSNGTLIDNTTLEEISITGSEARDRYALTLGFDLQKEISNNFSLSLGARYEGTASYQLSNGMTQSITPNYFSLGARVRF